MMEKEMEEEKARVPRANPYPYTTDYPVVQKIIHILVLILSILWEKKKKGNQKWPSVMINSVFTDPSQTWA